MRKRRNCKGPGRIFEPLVVYIRDEIAIPNIGEKTTKDT
jgi:F-type H+-transporting ATPase subunit a